MKTGVALLLLWCGIGAVCGRSLQQAAAPTASYNSLAQAVAAANASAPNLSILLAAVQAVNGTSAFTNETAWTILAPTDEAFTDRLDDSLGITPEQLLQPENRATLVDVLSYHVIPSAAVRSSSLRDGQNFTTALSDAAPLTVSIDDGSVKFDGAQDSATVITPDIVAGRSVIHVIDDVLLPAGVGNDDDDANQTATGGAGGSRADDTSAGDARAVDPNTAVGGGAGAPAAAPAPAPASSSASALFAKVPAVVLAAAMLVCMLF